MATEHTQPAGDAGTSELSASALVPTTVVVPKIYGVVAEFEDSDTLLAAARLAREAGYTRMDAFSPMPVEGLSKVLKFRDKSVQTLMLLGGLTGCATGYFMQWFAATQSYPLNVGGKPFYSWPQQIVITFEMTILFTALSGVLGMILLNGLPRPYHSIFNTPNFEAASVDRFFLAIESRDPKFDREGTRQFMQGMSAVRVSEVEE